MKKYIYTLILAAALMLTGCSTKDRMTNFIPTPAPGEAANESVTPTDEAKDNEDAGDVQVTKSPITTYDGKTTTKYVKLEEYGDVLNVRSSPSVDADAVGFLVHTDKIEVIEIKDGWASFLYKGSVCYVNADFLVDEKPDYLDPPSITSAPKSSNTTGTGAGTDGPQI